MIQAIGWHWAQQYGWMDAQEPPQTAEAAEVSAAMLASCAGGPIKYYARLTTDARLAMHAAGLALQAARWPAAVSGEAGLICGGYGGWVRACEAYYADYAAHGRAIGRANLFIYTLPTSVGSEIAIALRLGGPTLHLQDAARPLQFLLEQTEQMVTDGQAPGVLALWAEVGAAVCMAVGPGEGRLPLSAEDLRKGPRELAASLSAAARATRASRSECQTT